MSAKKHRSMRRTWEQVRTIPGLKKDVAALVVLVVAAIVSTVGVQSFMGGVPPWEDRFLMKVEFEEVPGLNPGATPHVATIAGVRVGDVASYEATGHGTAIVTLDMDPTVGTIYENATAVLRPKNPLNDMQVTIYPGGPPARPLANGGLIPVGQTKRPIQVNEALEHLDERAQKAVEDLMVASDVALASAPQDLPGGFQATDKTIASLRPAVEALQVRRENIAKLTTALGQIATALGGDRDRAVRLANATHETLKVIAQNDDDLVASFNEFPGLNDQLRAALSASQDLTSELDPTLDNLSKASEDLPDALDRFETTTRELGQTVDEAKDFVSKAKPVVADLRPFVDDADESLHDLTHVTEHLDEDTDAVTTYLTVIQAFFHNTSSVFGAGDGQGGNIRGHVVGKAPDGTHFLPGGDPGYAPGPEGGLVPGRPRYERTPIPPYVPGSEEHNDRGQAVPNTGLPSDARDARTSGGN